MSGPLSQGETAPGSGRMPSSSSAIAGIKLMLLLPLFFVQVAIGGSEYPIYSIALTIGLATLLLAAGRPLRLSLLLWGVVFAAVSLSHEIHSATHFWLAFKFLVLLSPALLLPTILHRREFDELLFRAAKICLVVSIVSFGCGQLTGTQFAADLGYGFPRMQGFASEPSSLALPVALVLIRGVMSRRVTDLGIAILAGALSLSLMVLVVSFLVMCAYLFFKAGRAVKFVLLMLVVVGLLYGLEGATRLGEVGADTASLSRLSEGLVFVFSGGEAGYNPRLDKAEFFEHYVSALGNGLNTYEGEELRDWNVHLEVIYAFGVAGWALFCACSVGVAWRLYRTSSVAFWQFTCAYVYVSLNSGQGIVFSVIVYSYFMMVLKNVRIVRRKGRLKVSPTPNGTAPAANLL